MDLGGKRLMGRAGSIFVGGIAIVAPLDCEFPWEVHLVISTYFFWRVRFFEWGGVVVELKTLVD